MNFEMEQDRLSDLVLKRSRLLKRAILLKLLRHSSDGQVGSSGNVDFTLIFYQIWFRTLPKPKLLGLLPIKTPSLALKGLEIGDRSLRNLIFFRKNLLERKA